MKALNWGYVIGTLVAVPLLIVLINFLFFRGNDVTPEVVDTYISKCRRIKLSVPETKALEPYTLQSKVYYPKLKRIGDGTRVYHKYVFYEKQYKKYFAIIYFEFAVSDGNRIYVRYDTLSREAIFVALVNTLQLENPEYGSLDNPVPVFSMELLASDGRERDQNDEYSRDFLISDETRRAYIEEYLNHFIPKDEFKVMFGKK